MKDFESFLKWERASKDTIDFKKVYVDMAHGDIIAGLLLSQIVYWHLPSRVSNRTRLRVRKDDHLWLAKGRDDWYEECRITSRQFDRASKILVEAGLIEKKLFKFNGSPTVHVRILQDPFLEALTIYTHSTYEDELDAEDEWIDDSKYVESLAEDAGCGSLDAPVHHGVSMRDAPDETEAGKSNSPNGENHNREDLLGFSLSNDKEKHASSLGDEEGKRKFCTVCQTRKPVDESIDTKGRCPLCLLVDGWNHYIGVRVPAYKTHENGRREYVGIENTRKLNTKMGKRLKEETWRQTWSFALARAGQMKLLKDNSWFNPLWFLGQKDGEANTVRIINGIFDGVNRDYDATSGQNLKNWLALQRAQHGGPSVNSNAA